MNTKECYVEIVNRNVESKDTSGKSRMQVKNLWVQVENLRIQMENLRM